MSTPTIPAGNLFMNANLYGGTNATQVITNGVAGQAMQPDFLWVKRRDTSGSHLLWDSVRGVTLGLNSDRTAAEQTATGGTGLASFNSNGFTLGGDFSGTGSSNTSGATYVGWQWKAGGTAVSNTAGSITSSVSANTTSGFSVVTYTGNGTSGATVGHGLGVTPAMIIVKNRSGANYWIVQHQSLTSVTYNLYLNDTSNQQNDGQFQAKSSSTFTLTGGGSVNINSNNFVAYCWAPIAGYSAFGSYTGNGSADGPFIYTGFRPAFIMLKRTDTAGTDWVIMDYQRLGYNVTDVALNPNANYAENSGYGTDFVSNGFKLRTTTSFLNASGGTYVYACFAQNPFKYSNAR